MYGWCASDGAGIARAVPWPPPPPVPSLHPSLPTRVGCWGSLGGFLPLLSWVGIGGPYCCPGPLGPFLVWGMRLSGPGKFGCVASCPVPCHHQSNPPSFPLMVRAVGDNNTQEPNLVLWGPDTVPNSSETAQTDRGRRPTPLAVRAQRVQTTYRWRADGTFWAVGDPVWGLLWPTWGRFEPFGQPQTPFRAHSDQNP